MNRETKTEPSQPETPDDTAALPGSLDATAMAIADRSPAAIEAMEATFALCKAISGPVTINDLKEVCDMEIEEGHGLMCLKLELMQTAIGLSRAARPETQHDPQG